MGHIPGKYSLKLAVLLLVQALFLFLSFPVLGMGLEAPPALSLSAAFDTALSHNPAMNQAFASRKKADSQVRQSISAFLPKLDLQAGYARSNNPVMVFGNKLNQADFTRQDFQVDKLNNPDYRDNWQAMFMLTQPIFNQGREYVGYKTSRLAQDISKLGLYSTGQYVLYMVERAYCQALLAQEKVHVLEAALKTASAHRDLSQRRYLAGLVLKSDVLSAEVQKTNTERQLFQAQNDLRVAIAALNRAMGVSQDKEWQLQELENEKQDSGSLDSWLGKARKCRPEVLMARDELKIAEYNHRQAQFRFLPSFNLHGIYQQDRKTFADFGGDSWAFMATMSVNLFNGLGDFAQLSAARAETEKKAARLKDVESSIELEVRKAFYGFQTARKQLEVSLKAVRQAVESQRILKNRYENGLALMVELLAADTSVRETRLGAAKARFDARLAWSELRWKTGVLGREIIDQAGSSNH